MSFSYLSFYDAEVPLNLSENYELSKTIPETVIWMSQL